MITFEVLGAPQGKARPKARQGKGFIQMYTPAKTVSYEATIANAAHAAMAGRPLLDCAVRVDIFIRCQAPQSWSPRKRREAEADGFYPTVKPDVDNVEKAIFDAINGVVWRDDVVVVDVNKRKRYRAIPGLVITIEPMPLPVQPSLDLKPVAVPNEEFFEA